MYLKIDGYLCGFFSDSNLSFIIFLELHFFQGDSGGPVINMKQQLVGLVSWGKANDPLGYPKVFADLGSPGMRSFIDDVLVSY